MGNVATIDQLRENGVDRQTGFCPLGGNQVMGSCWLGMCLCGSQTVRHSGRRARASNALIARNPSLLTRRDIVQPRDADFWQIQWPSAFREGRLEALGLQVCAEQRMYSVKVMHTQDQSAMESVIDSDRPETLFRGAVVNTTILCIQYKINSTEKHPMHMQTFFSRILFISLLFFGKNFLKNWFPFNYLTERDIFWNEGLFLRKASRACFALGERFFPQMRTKRQNPRHLRPNTPFC